MTLIRHVPGLSDVNNLGINIHRSEMAFANAVGNRAWWQVDDNGAHGDDLAERYVWRDRLLTHAAKDNATNPSPPVFDNAVLKGSSSSLPLSTADPVLSVVSDWCLWALVRHGITSDATAVAFVGDNGGELGLLATSGNKFLFAGSLSSILSPDLTYTSTQREWGLVVVERGGGGVSLYVDGALIQTKSSYSIPSGTTGRISIMGAYDETLGKIAGANGLYLRACGAAQTTYSGEFKDTLRDMCNRMHSDYVTVT